TDIKEMDKIKAKTDKAEHEKERVHKSQELSSYGQQNNINKEDIQELRSKLLEDVRNINEELSEYINCPSWNRHTFYDNNDDEYTIIYSKPKAITPDLPTKEPDNSLIMGDKHLDTIPETESDEFIKSSVENLVPTPSESEDECECDMPDCDDSQTINFLTYSNLLFDDSTSSDDESSHEEEIHKMSFITYSNPLFDLDEEIISINHDTLMVSPPKIDFLFDEFAGELTLLKSIPSGINDDNLDPKSEIHLVERLLYDNSSPHPPEDSKSDVSDAITESFSPSSIPVEDSNSLIDEIDLFLTLDDSMPSGIENDDYDSEGDILSLEELLSSNSPSLPKDSTIDVVEEILVDVPNIFPTHPTLYMDFDFIPSHNDLGSDLDVSSPS
ncbi:hypothetical protein Tco_0631924, partial [Tanacetum coccineum]